MGKYTRTYGKWAGYMIDDCSCEFCLIFAGRKRPCPLTVCYCAEEREEALRREQSANVTHATRKGECYAGFKQRAS